MRAGRLNKRLARLEAEIRLLRAEIQLLSQRPQVVNNYSVTQVAPALKYPLEVICDMAMIRALNA